MSSVVELAAAVQRALDDSEAELKDMPFFVRPMVRRGLASRTGRSFDEWRAALRSPSAALVGDLEQLADHFRTAPERAKRGPAGRSDEAMAIISARAASREAAVRALIAALR